CILFNIVLSAWTVLHNDILFHTDLARDFLLFEDIVKNKPLTLIGPRSGGISGLFHGPLWLYLNIPAFILGDGNPVIVGWFWVVLFVLYLGIVYVVAKKLFDKRVGILSILLASAVSVGSVSGLFNPFGAVMLLPVYFYFLYRYVEEKNVFNLIISLFVLGLIIQFQMAFGIPMLFLTLLYVLYFVIKKKRIPHLLSFLILIIPLSTHILFELRHQFLETKSFFHYVTTNKSQKAIEIMNVVLSRLKGFFVEGLGMIGGGAWVLTGALIIFFLITLWKICTNKRIKSRNIYYLFLYLYMGFWLLTFLYKGVIWGYYYWPFLPLIIIIFSSFYKYVPKVFYTLFVCILVLSFYQNIRSIQTSVNFFAKDGSSWRFNYDLAKTIFNDAPNEFGYYIFTPDLFGYSPRYAMHYAQSKRSDKKAFPFEKKNITYLIIAPPPNDRLFLDGEWWRINQVKITKKLLWSKRYEKGFKVEKYELDNEELKIASDPNLIQTLFFR
ncbi:glycosyltransferase family 39 protein, partial [Candidatus Roizmanbacteria bacterium]|nr:glycosyltransferase family 39 protein [Candidatus Roizmanbacteria bacterium]